MFLILSTQLLEKSRFAVHVQEHVQLGNLFTASDSPFLCTFHQELRQA